jgi:hypothetical protein
MRMGVVKTHLLVWGGQLTGLGGAVQNKTIGFTERGGAERPRPFLFRWIL